MNDRISDYIDGKRLWSRLMDLASFGATGRGGVCRLALSREEIQARAALVRWGEEVALRAAVDDAANLFLRLEGLDPDLPPVLIGSHIDTQPTGGKFDGAYGVVAALECVAAIAATGRRPQRSIEVVAWMNEEGSRFAPGMMGSAVFTGVRELEDVMAVLDAEGCSVRTAVDVVLAAESGLLRRPLGFAVAAFVEAHIEQGPLLEAEGKTIGVVTGIGGKRTFRVVVEGEASHAGTSARSERRDALVSAVAIVDALQRAIWDAEDTVRFTIGKFTVEPNAPSVVPARVVFSIDLRHGEVEVLRTLGERIPSLVRAARGKCEVTVTELLYDAPLEFPATIRAQVAAAASRLGLAHRVLPSPAGHDARYLHYYCPTGMIFIPCKGGLSHSEAESITPSDAEAGARVLIEVVAELAGID